MMAHACHDSELGSPALERSVREVVATGRCFLGSQRSTSGLRDHPTLVVDRALSSLC